MERNAPQRTPRRRGADIPPTPPPDGWSLDLGLGPTITATHEGDGRLAVIYLENHHDGHGFRWRIYRADTQAGDHSYLTDVAGELFPFVEIEQWANAPERMYIMTDLFNRRHEKIEEGEPVAMLLPASEIHAKGKKSDAFYEQVLAYVRHCEELGIKFGPRLAKDNRVPEQSVYNWLRTAKQREKAKKEATS